MSLIRNYRLSQRVWSDASMKWFHLLLLGRYASLCIVWLLIYGDVRIMLHDMLMLILFMERLAIPGIGTDRHPESP